MAWYQDWWILLASMLENFSSIESQTTASPSSLLKACDWKSGNPGYLVSPLHNMLPSIAAFVALSSVSIRRPRSRVSLSLSKHLTFYIVSRVLHGLNAGTYCLWQTLYDQKIWQFLHAAGTSSSHAFQSLQLREFVSRFVALEEFVIVNEDCTD